MRKKIIGMLIVVTLVMISLFGSVVSSERIDFIREISEQYTEYPECNENNSQIYIYASISILAPKTDIRLLDGNSSQIEKIERILNNRFLQIIPPFFKIVECTDLDFSVNFTQDAADLGFFGLFFRWYFRYFTSLYEEGEMFWEGEMIDSISHTVEVKGFNGGFIFTRPRLWTPLPSHCGFMGEYEEVTIIQ